MAIRHYSPWVLSGRDLDPFFGLSDVLGDYDRQMKQMMREFNRLESQFMGGQEEYPTGLSSLLDRSAICPRIVDQDGKKVAQYNFDVRGFNPEDVSIKTNDGRLIVTGRHQEKSEDHEAVREFHRMVQLPEDANLEDMKSRLQGGVLTISAPLPSAAIENTKTDVKEIPIQHDKVKAIK